MFHHCPLQQVKHWHRINLQIFFQLHSIDTISGKRKKKRVFIRSTTVTDVQVQTHQGQFQIPLGL